MKEIQDHFTANYYRKEIIDKNEEEIKESLKEYSTR